jgi:hypothetical protein
MGNDKRIKINSIPEKLDNDLLKHLVIIDKEIFVRHFLCSSLLPVDPLNKSSNNFFVNQTYLKISQAKILMTNHLSLLIIFYYLSSLFKVL